MMQHNSYKILSSLLLIIAIVVFIGCEKKTEQQNTEVKSESALQDTLSGASEVVTEESMIAIPDIRGSYTGTLHNRPTTLKITEQTDSSFSGEITINYREVMNNKIKGTFSPSTSEFSMSDQIHNRYMGKYKGKISADGKSLTGKFFPDYDKLEASFNLKKK